MNKFMTLLSKAALSLFACGMLFSCSSGDEAVNQTPTPGPEPTPEKEAVTLSVDTNTITADGKSMAIFTVKDKENTDVTTKAKITCSTTGTALQAYVFTTEVAGDYEFYATYNNTKSNTVKVTATAEELQYILTATPMEIVADGIETVTFTVADKSGEDLTEEAVIYCVTKEVDLRENTFSTYDAGEYQFFAKIGDKENFEKSNTVTINATLMESEVNNPTPIRWSEMKATPLTDVGCEIEVTGLQNKNFQFVIRPGAEVVTYRLDVYPLCRLYNSLFVELCNNEEYTETKEWSVVEEQIRTYVFDASGAGAFAFDANGGQEREFDWMNTQYNQANVVPDAEYLIVAVGCTDTEGFEQGEMTIAYLKTPSEELIGDPRVEITVETGWKKARVSHKAATDDCKYFYHFYSWEGDLQPYIMAYGRTMYRDFMRHTLYDPTDINDGENNYYMLNWSEGADPSIVWLASAIGLDRNQTPALDFQSERFQLKTVPESVVEGTGTMTMDERYISSTIAWYDYTIDDNARSMFNKVYNSSTIAANKDDEQWCAAVASDIINNGGWGHANKNFGYDTEHEIYTGSSFTGRDFQIIPEAIEGNGSYESGGEYQFAYVFKDAANNGSSVNFTEPFRIKERVMDNPEACQSNGVATLSAAGRTSVKFTCEYDFETTSCIYFCWYPGDASNMSSSEIINTIFNPNSADPKQLWWAVEGGHDELTLAGFDPDTTYTMLYVYEDWNGVFSEGRYTSCTTASGDGGANPAVTVEYEETADGLEVDFYANDDTKYMKYAAANKTDYGTTLDLDYLGEPYLGDPQADAQYYLDLWTTWVIGEAGMMTYNTSTGIFNALGKDDLYIAICVPFGKDDVRGKAAYVIYDHGKVKTLHDYYDYEGEPMSTKKYGTKFPKVGEPNRREIPAMLKRPAEIKWENSIDKIVGHEVKVIDMRTIASHPNAR